MDDREFGRLIGMAVKATTPLAGMVVKNNVVAINGDATKARELACTYVSDMQPIMNVRDWAVGMTTEPGELVYDPDKKYRYMYSGATKMTHSNELFYPGSVGVYYWSIVPEILNGAKCFPDIQGIVVFVRKDDIWYNPERTAKYVWTGDDYDCPSGYYPGATGVHQWELIIDNTNI